MRLRIVSATTIAALAVVTSGCAKPSVVGKWSGTISQQSPIGGNISMTVNLEYKADGTMVQTATLPNNLGNITATGTYTISGDQMTTKVTNLEASALIKQLAGKQLEKQMTQTGTFKVEGDTLTFSGGAGGGQSFTLNRVKE